MQTRIFKALFPIVIILLFVLTTSIQAQESVNKLLEQIELGEPLHYGDLTVIPLLNRTANVNLDFLTLEQALEKDLIEITELEGGSVPRVKIVNKADKPIYIMGGEVITGCKQDRVVGKDILIRPHNKQTIVPVYCVESSRWTYESDQFYSKGNSASPNIREKAQKSSNSSQSEIWDEVYKMNEEMGVDTDTNAYQDAYENEEVKEQIKQYEEKLKTLPRQYPHIVGVLIAVGAEVVSVDIFANSYLFKELWPKLLKSTVFYALYAEESGTFGEKEALAFLNMLSLKTYDQRNAVDLGRELALVDKDINLNALVYQNFIIHLAAFPYVESEASSNEQTGNHQGSSNQAENNDQIIFQQRITPANVVNPQLEQ